MSDALRPGLPGEIARSVATLMDRIWGGRIPAADSERQADMMEAARR